MSKPRSSAQLARDRQLIANLYFEGWTQSRIAAQLGLSQPTVSRDIKALQRDWLASALIDYDQAKANELAHVDRLEREYWDAWRRSCEDAETVKQRGTPGEEQGKVKTAAIERTVKGQAGDPRFLQGVQWCIDRRCKILGIDAPEKHEFGGRDVTIRIGGVDLANDI
jgi:AraC-like DNA-binding protein